MGLGSLVGRGTGWGTGWDGRGGLAHSSRGKRREEGGYVGGVG
jgi:hypothetical protein